MNVYLGQMSAFRETDVAVFASSIDLAQRAVVVPSAFVRRFNAWNSSTEAF